ncbi:SGNH/GDSL hydrolase family protein [Mucilaginibacter sp.]
MTTDNTKPPKGKKLLLFKVLAALFPFILLVLLEFVLRFFNYGHNTDLFVKDPYDARYMVMNDYASDKFFSDTANATKGNHEIFAIDKAPNTFRIFVLGESTTIGYPYFHNGSFHRWLQYRLSRMYPDKNFEIINLSLTATNSYTVLDYGRQLAQYHPDAVLIYSGHNEYYGALGVGSTSYIGSNRFLVQTLLKLRTLKVVQLFNNMIKKVSGVFASHKPADRETLMQRMAARQHIDYNSIDYQAGIKQFDANMTELCRLLNNEKIPAFLSTVVSNEKDLPPFISAGTGPGSATGFYKAGQQAMEKADYATAKQDFDKARELDGLRFRAPEAINTIIRRLTTEFPEVHLVDTKKEFEQYSPHGIVGNETILEHLHPNLHGYSIMSDAFFQAMQSQHLLPDSAETQISFEQLQKEMPVTKMDSLIGAIQITNLKTGWPFNQPIPAGYKPDTSLSGTLASQIESAQLNWAGGMSQLYGYYKNSNDKAGALKIMMAMNLEYPNEKQYCGDAANIAAIIGNYDESIYYYRKLNQLDPNDQLSVHIFQLYLRANNPKGALGFVKDLPSAQQTAATGILKQIISDENILSRDPGNKAANGRMVSNLRLLGLTDLATKYIGK